MEAYAAETVRTVVIAEIPARPINSTLVNYLRKKLQDNSSGRTPRMILEAMTDHEVLEVYHSHHATLIAAMKANIPVKSRFM